MNKKQSTTYKDAGVDIEAGNELVRRIKTKVASTFRPEVMTDIGGFGALFKFDPSKYKNPVLVSCTDGVGTKLKLAFMADRHNTVGIDLVAMSVNDLVVQGAEPLFFLDYIGTGKVNPEVLEQVVSGIADGCSQSGCSLIGGETAEMPSMYAEGEYDLAGFAVGVVDQDRLITGKTIQAGDHLIGLASSGIHSNGYSLVRKVIFEQEGLNINDPFLSSGTVADELLKPTKLYVKPVLQLIEKVAVKGLVHITGGGFTENIPRVLPEGLSFEIDHTAYPRLEIFEYLQKTANISEEDMRLTFNLGIGMVAVVAPDDVELALLALKEAGEEAYLIGHVTKAEN